MNRTRYFFTLIMAVVVLMSTTAVAQETGAEPDDPPASAKPTEEVSEEIIVTATKREQPLQDVPIPVAALSGDELAESQISSLEDLQFRVPNITFGNDFNFAKLYVRGRVEVLRGPQGTLYGRNNTGGTVNLVTRKPAGQRGGHLRFTVGGDDLNLMAEGGVDVPFSEKVLSRFAFRAQDREGYGINETSGNDIDDAQQYAGRASLLFLPTDHFDFTFTAEYYEEDDHAYAVKFLAPSFEGDPPGFTALGLPGLAENPRNTRSREGFEPMNFKNTWYLTGTANWLLNDNLSVRSITNFRKLKTILLQDFTMSDTFVHQPLPLLPGQTSAIHDLEERQWQASEEIQVLYDSGRMHSIFGAYWLREEVDSIGHDPLNTADDRLVRVLLDGRLEVDAYAVFANFTWRRTDRGDREPLPCRRPAGSWLVVVVDLPGLCRAARRGGGGDVLAGVVTWWRSMSVKLTV